MRGILLIFLRLVPASGLPVASGENCEGTVCADVTLRAFGVSGSFTYNADGRASSSFVSVEGTLTLAPPGAEDACAGFGTCSMHVEDPVVYPERACHVGVATASSPLDTVTDSAWVHC